MHACMHATSSKLHPVHLLHTGLTSYVAAVTGCYVGVVKRPSGRSRIGQYAVHVQ